MECNNHRKRAGNLSRILSIIFISALLFLTGAVSAEPVNRVRAEKLVIGWLRTDSRPLGAKLGGTIKDTVAFNDDQGNVLYYVIYLEPSGFVIVAGDDLAEPIICFAEAGEFDPSEDNPLGALVKKDLPNRIAAVRAMPRASVLSLNNKERWDRLSGYADGGGVGVLGLDVISDARVEPFVLSTWGQSTIGHIIGNPACYNYYTLPGPDGDPDNYPCGCVATATSQLMRYHEHPGSYSWANMPLDPNLSTTELERQTIGDLCHDVAEAIDTDYGPDGSSASLYDADSELVASFGYSNSIYGITPSIGTVLNAIINPNLDAGKAVILGLDGPDGGHAVICDGYGYNSPTLYHHLNMGWDGSDNAWYNLPTVDAYYSYNVVDDCIYNVFVSGTGEIISGRVTDSGGNPIPDVTVTATASGAGPYYAVTNSKGIYALANVASNKSYTLTASKAPYTFTNQYASTGQSSDSGSSSGNVWGVNFVSGGESPPIAHDQEIETTSGTIETVTLQAGDDGLPNPPSQLRYIITQLPSRGRLTDPNGGVISDVPYTIASNGDVVEYQSCGYYAGPDDFEFVANDYGTAPTGGDSEPATVSIDVDNVVYTTFELQTNLYASWPMQTYYHDSRTQVIYLSSEIGDAKTITDLALSVYQVPGQTLNNWTIRMKHTSRNYYSGYPYFETSGWTIVYQNNETISSAGWQNFHFQNAFEYNGTSNLMIDFSHNNSYYSYDGYCLVSDMGIDRVLLSFADSTYGDPLYWSDSYNPGIYLAEGVPNIKLIGTVPAEPLTGDIERDCDVDFVDVAIMADAWLSQSGEPGFNEDCDIVPDNEINGEDLEQLVTNWLADAF